MRRRSPVEERRQAAADPEVDPGHRVRRVLRVHVVALGVRHHLERQLVVVAEEEAPLAGGGDLRRALHDLDERLPVLEPQGHEHPRHEREVEGHVEAVAVPEVGPHVLRPHVGLGEQQPPRELRVHPPPQLPHHLVGLGQVLAGGALALHEVGHGVHPEPVHPELEPEAHHLPDLLAHGRVVEVEVGLVGEEPVPVVGLRDRVPGPVRHLGVAEDDPHAAVAVVGVAPDVVVALRAVGRGAGLLEPGVLVGGVVEHQLGDHPEAPLVGGAPGTRWKSSRVPYWGWTAQ